MGGLCGLLLWVLCEVGLNAYHVQHRGRRGPIRSEEAVFSPTYPMVATVPRPCNASPHVVVRRLLGT